MKNLVDKGEKKLSKKLSNPFRRMNNDNLRKSRRKTIRMVDKEGNEEIVDKKSLKKVEENNKETDRISNGQEKIVKSDEMQQKSNTDNNTEKIDEKIESPKESNATEKITDENKSSEQQKIIEKPDDQTKSDENSEKGKIEEKKNENERSAKDSETKSQGNEAKKSKGKSPFLITDENNADEIAKNVAQSIPEEEKKELDKKAYIIANDMIGNKVNSNDKQIEEDLKDLKGYKAIQTENPNDTARWPPENLPIEPLEQPSNEKENSNNEKSKRVAIDETQNNEKFYVPQANRSSNTVDSSKNTAFAQIKDSNKDKKISSNSNEQKQNENKILTNKNETNASGEKTNRISNENESKTIGSESAVIGAGAYFKYEDGKTENRKPMSDNPLNNGKNTVQDKVDRSDVDIAKKEKSEKKKEVIEKEIIKKEKLAGNKKEYLAAGLVPPSHSAEKKLIPLVDDKVEETALHVNKELWIDTDVIDPDCELALDRRNGRLMYEGPIIKRRYFFSCFWHVRHFTLDKDGILRYYRNKNKEGKGHMNVLELKDMRRLDELNKNHSFRIILKHLDGEDILAFDDETERNMWALKLAEIRQNKI
ncbi:hypothetical protein EDEG_02149 [Edhazardia aedis USNM 41457]|uniref:PH domain-containing protein n=1 Tax=Edhazardia aedis (strain USNM 41457) TaxID=1003232 RepID=J8ZV32_EDHAE|nr:hypothetical protein EDEG_02149 [Edhazardia aedis USNM 41457]|eukprot:EJW03528.1 hypothetical protein EDEG_02149 [Edhazardia aedis USNM 41457]